MPTVHNMDLPKPSSWAEFETIVRDAMALTWASPGLQKQGRPGQAQNGVDVWGDDHMGRLVGIQCKRYEGYPTLDQIKAEITKAEDFDGTLSALYIAVSAKHDTPLQTAVRTLSQKRTSEGKFAVAMLFWDEIVTGLTLNPAVFEAHYPQFKLNRGEISDRNRLIAALELGYYGADLHNTLLLIHGEIGQMTQVDPDEFQVRLHQLEARATQLLGAAEAERVNEVIVQLRDGCVTPKHNDSDWEPVEVAARRASSRIAGAASTLVDAEGNFLELGMQLGCKFACNTDPLEGGFRVQS